MGPRTRRCSIRGSVALMLGCAIGSTAMPLLAAPPCEDPATDLVHYWHGDGDADDSVGTADGTESAGFGYTSGRFGQGFAFDGVDDSVSFGASAGNFGTSDVTVSYWIRSTNTTEIQGVLGKRSACMHGSFWDNRLNHTGTMNVELDQDAGATNHNSQATAATMNDGAFHLLSFVREGVEARIYVDGVLSASHSTLGTTNISNAANLRAGLSACTGIDGTQHFTGILDEIQIYDRALAPCEILAGVDAGLDLDLDGEVRPLTDMLLLLRYFFDFRGSTLIAGATGADCLRCDAQTIEVVIDALGGLDVDGNGMVEAQYDGILFLRYSFGFRGDALIANAIQQPCSRCDAPAVESFLDPLFP